MADYYGYLATISAVLGGFALTFFGALLMNTSGRASSWTAGLSAAATGAFSVSAIGWALAASGLALASGTGAADGASFIASFRPIHRTLSLVLIGGIFLFLASLGVAGWIRSRAMGIVTTGIAGASVVLVLSVLSFVVS